MTILSVPTYYSPCIPFQNAITEVIIPFLRVLKKNLYGETLNGSLHIMDYNKGSLAAADFMTSRRIASLRSSTGFLQQYLRENGSKKIQACYTRSETESDQYLRGDHKEEPGEVPHQTDEKIGW